ncbi:putative transporter MCH2 [Lachnellula suecica]|uniref:Putative transporter MCH2 n=1 Tax=Lachnellula suecica TaxID=602035 RepID=A0A8T9C6V2_9HELO|nr:putative transporter MCH2 [Lachnellula suecica]
MAQDSSIELIYRDNGQYLEQNLDEIQRGESGAGEGGILPASSSAAIANVVEEEDVPPNGGYGWICVICIFWVNAHTWGINSAYGIFLAYYLSSNTFPNATPLQYAFIGGLSISQALIVSPLVTLITRRYTFKTSMFIGLALETGALVGASFASQVWHLFLSQGFCFGWGMGFLYIGSAGIVPQWFSSRRSLAMGITSAGAGFGGLAYNLGTSALISQIGLSWALRVLALCQFVVNGVCTVALKDRTKAIKPNQLAFDYRLLGEGYFLLLIGWGFFSELGYVVLLFSLPNYALSIGLSTHQGAVVGALLNLGLGIGRPIVGYFSDSMGRLNMATAMTGLCGVLCLLIWTFAKSFGLLCFFALLAGTVCGTFWSTVVPVGAEIVGLKDLPSALSIAFMMMMFPTTFAEPIALKLRRAHGDIYLDAQIFTGIMFITAALCSWFIRSWKVTDDKRKELSKRRREECRPNKYCDLETGSPGWINYAYTVFKNLFVWIKGRALIRALLEPSEQDYSILALTRKASGVAAQQLRELYAEEEVGIVEGDLDDEASIRTIFQDVKGGVWGVFTVLPYPGLGVIADGEEKQGKMLADLALEFGVKTFVYSSMMRDGPKYDGQLKLSAKAKFNIENYCRELGEKGLPWTFIQPGFFMENFENFIGSIAVSVIKSGLNADTTIGFIASEDIGNVAAGVFREPGKYKHETLVAVSEFSTMSQLEESHKKATGKPIPAVPWVFARAIVKMNKATQSLIEKLLLNHQARISGEYPECEPGVQLANSVYKMRTYYEWKSQEKREDVQSGNWNQVSLGKLLTGKM